MKVLAKLFHQVLFTADREAKERQEEDRVTPLQQLIGRTMIQWAQQPIHSPELIQQVFALLFRQYDEINEVVREYILLQSIKLDPTPSVKLLVFCTRRRV